jgi:putative cardiolipin synthase
MITNALLDFRGSNQRMHDKTAIFDSVAGITGGRNMADEYFDFDHEYNFRDRDILILGPAVRDMRANFDEFWASALSVPVEELVSDSDLQVTPQEVQEKYAQLHEYADDPANFELAIKEAIEDLPTSFPGMLAAMSWHDVHFISDAPGKNEGDQGLGGGGASTSDLVEAVSRAEHSVLIQSPYLVLPKGGIELLSELHERGVRIRISTNSLASTDNLAAFVGYFRQRKRLLNAGVELYEYMPHPQIQADLVERYPRLADKNPVFAIHAKSMVIDDHKIFIGTFNLDPRSANLNTEVGVLIESESLARELTQSIERDLRPENSWQTTHEFNPDREVSRSKRLTLGFINLFPIESIL